MEEIVHDREISNQINDSLSPLLKFLPVSNHDDLIYSYNYQRKCTYKVIQRTEKNSQGFFSSVNYLNWLYLSTNVAQYSHLTLTLLQMCSGTFQERSWTAFMLALMFKSQILILKFSENLFVWIPAGFETDLEQTTNALSVFFLSLKFTGPFGSQDFL